jgi:hypothetical protein
MRLPGTNPLGARSWRRATDLAGRNKRDVGNPSCAAKFVIEQAARSPLQTHQNKMGLGPLVKSASTAVHGCDPVKLFVTTFNEPVWFGSLTEN